MRKTLWAVLTLVTVATASLAVACGDDDDNVTPKTDAGNEATVTPPGPPGPGPDGGGDAGCTFAGYVIGLINTQTTPMAQPTMDLGDKCTPSTSQDDFKPLF